MREITPNEVKDPTQLQRYLRDVASKLGELSNRAATTPPVEFIPVPPQPQQQPLPEQVLADLGLTQIARVRNLNATAAPTTADNLSAGYTAGSKWYLPNTPAIYECVYSDNETATWVQVF